METLCVVLIIHYDRLTRAAAPPEERQLHANVSLLYVTQTTSIHALSWSSAQWMSTFHVQ